MSSRRSEGSEESDETESDTDVIDPLLGREPLTAEQVYAICSLRYSLAAPSRERC